MVHQQGDVLAPLAQGGQVDGYDLEPVVQVVAEVARGDLGGEIPIGRGQQAHVNLDGLDPAHALDLLIQIYIFYFCLAAAIGYDNPVVVGTFTLGAFAGAYITEIVRAGIESIDRGQAEAALSTGLSRWQTLRYVIFPQAFRRIIPPVTGQFVSLIKDSSLLSVISVRELTKAAEVINATTYKTFEAYLPLAFMYLLLTYPLSHLTQMLEKRLRTD